MATKRKPEESQAEAPAKRAKDEAENRQQAISAPASGQPKMSAAEVSENLDQWIRAKRAKDFYTSDRIRDELRKEGIEAKLVRPADKNRQAVQAAETDRQLQDWDKAKTNGDETTANRLEDFLRKKGVEATPGRKFLEEQLELAKAANDHIAANRLQLEMQRTVGGGAAGPVAATFTPPAWRPPSQIGGYNHLPPQRSGYAVPGQKYDAETERQLDEWVNAKRAKDFTASDRLRDELRRKGIEAKLCRPADGSSSWRSSSYSAPAPVPAPAPAPAAYGGYYGAQAYGYPAIPYPGFPAYPAYPAYPPSPYGVPAPAAATFPAPAAGAAPVPTAPTAYAPAPAAYPYPPQPAGVYAAYAVPAPIAYGYQAYAYPPTPTPGYPAAVPAAPAAVTAPAGTGAYDKETEQQLNAWVQAKRAFDFTTSDRIRSELRQKGIEPDQARPNSKR